MSQVDVEITNLSKSFGSLKAVDNISFQVEKGSFFSILGPSGCGKTTTLRVLSGFEQPDEGDIIVGGKRVNDLPPNKRNTNLVFQHLALFPLKNVFENVAYGLKRRKVPGKEIRQIVGDILARVGLEGFEPKAVTQLSGGQQQRVAIARCLVLNPTVLLLDEPLGPLDLKLREVMKLELKRLQHQIGTTFIYITHDQTEALVMSDKIAVMDAGRIVQMDTPEVLYHQPVTEFVAGFVGDSNVFKGKIDDSSVPSMVHDGKIIGLPQLPQSTTRGPVKLFVRYEDMWLVSVDEKPNDRDLNHFSGRIIEIDFDGANSRVVVEVGFDEPVVVLTSSRPDGHVGTIGQQVEVCWNKSSGHVFQT